MAAMIELRNCRSGATRRFRQGMDWPYLLTFPLFGGAFGLLSLVRYRLVGISLIQAVFGLIFFFIFAHYYWDLPAMFADHRLWQLAGLDFLMLSIIAARGQVWSVAKHLKMGWSLTVAAPLSPALTHTPARAQLVPEPLLPAIRKAA